jgi:hypothetical protein
MNELIEAIRLAVADGATTDQKAAGVLACRTIATALDTEPGKPFTLPGTPIPVTSRVSIDQVLDLAIARLSVIAKESETQQPPTPLQPTAPQSRLGASRGLQIPMAATSSALRAVPRPAPSRPIQPNTRPANTRPATKPAATNGRKP